VESDIRDNPAKSRFEMPLSVGALPVAYYKVENGRVSHAPHEGAATPTVRIAAGAWRFRSGATRWKKGDREVPLRVFLLRPTPRVWRTPRRLIEDGRPPTRTAL
jgi:hypothetical protein